MFLKNISKETFNPTGEMMVEYARLLQSFGKGESACMADFLYYGIKRGKLSTEECEQFVKDVVVKGSKLPTVDFEKYLPNALN